MTEFEIDTFPKLFEPVVTRYMVPQFPALLSPDEKEHGVPLEHVLPEPVGDTYAEAAVTAEEDVANAAKA